MRRFLNPLTINSINLELAIEMIKICAVGGDIIRCPYKWVGGEDKWTMAAELPLSGSLLPRDQRSHSLRDEDGFGSLQVSPWPFSTRLATHFENAIKIIEYHR